MLTKKYICLTTLKLKLCVADMANDYVKKSNLGRENDLKKISSNIKFVLSGINTLESYNNSPVVNRNKITVSQKGRFSFKNVPESVSLLKLDPDQVNCLSEKEICELIKKLLTLCPNC